MKARGDSRPSAHHEERPMRKHAAVLCVVAALALAPSAFAQRTTGTLMGTVADESGAVLPGVSVALKGEAVVGTQTAVSGPQGVYRFAALPPGTYEVTFTLAGFSTLRRSGAARAGGGHGGGERLLEGEPDRRGSHRQRRIDGGGHHHQPDQHQLRQGLGAQRPHPALHLLRPHQRRPRREPGPDRRLALDLPRQLLHRQLVPARRHRLHGARSPARPGPGPTRTRSRRSKCSRWAPPPSTATSRARSSTS